MPDLLSHALVAFALGTIISVRYQWIDRRWVTVLMIGAIVPDTEELKLLVSDPVVEQLLGVPFSWELLHLPIGTLLVCLLGTLLVGDGYRRRVFALLVVGASTHYALDLLAVFATGYSYPLLWPLSDYHVPAGDLYQSSDRWPLCVAFVFAVVAVVVDHRVASN
jgi:membrane-bound metal-dependent hydrolase YbcI (DUF457 family)